MRLRLRWLTHVVSGFQGRMLLADSGSYPDLGWVATAPEEPLGGHIARSSACAFHAGARARAEPLGRSRVHSSPRSRRGRGPRTRGWAEASDITGPSRLGPAGHRCLHAATEPLAGSLDARCRAAEGPRLSASASVRCGTVAMPLKPVRPPEATKPCCPPPCGQHGKQQRMCVTALMVAELQASWPWPPSLPARGEFYLFLG